MLFAFILKFKLKEKTIMRQSLIAAGMFLLTGGMVGCGTSSTQEKEDLIVVDVSKDYPKKELILQDLFDVEYIPLETTDEFVTLGWLQAIGKDVMIIRNMFAADGDIFIYDRKGKAIRHINRKGQGNEEYAATNGIYLDDEKGELFVGNLRQRKIMRKEKTRIRNHGFIIKRSSILTGITSSAKMLVVGVISMGLIRILSLGIYS